MRLNILLVKPYMPTDEIQPPLGLGYLAGTIRKKHNVEFGAADIIGKKWMCMQEADALPPGDFIEYCKKLRDENQCEFYINTRKASRRPTLEAESNLNEIKALGPLHVGEVFGHCRKPKLCPYEMAAMLAKDSKVIIADYNCVFNPDIRDNFFTEKNYYEKG